MSSSPAKLAPARMTYDQYCLLPEDRNQHELIDGELVMTPSPTTEHQRIVFRLARILADFVEKHSLGEVFIAPLDTIFDPYTALQPDILFVRQDRLAEVGKERIEGAPDLVVEILSPSTFHKDLRRKMAVYSQFGVQEYWIVDPEIKAIELHTRGAGGLQLARRFSESEEFESPLLSGLKFRPATIF